MTNGEVVSPQGGGKLGGGGQQQLRRDSTQSDDGNIQLVFSSSVDGSARMASTGNDVRDRCRELLAKAMKKGFSDGEEGDGLRGTNIVCFYFFLLLTQSASKKKSRCTIFHRKLRTISFVYMSWEERSIVIAQQRLVYYYFTDQVETLEETRIVAAYRGSPSSVWPGNLYVHYPLATP